MNRDEQMKELFSHLKTKMKMDETPSKAHLVQFPKKMENEVLRIHAKPMYSNIVGTIIIATVTRGYTETMFEDDVITTCEYFKIKCDDKKLPTDDQINVRKILLKPVNLDEEDTDLKLALDSKDATEQIMEVVNYINTGSRILTNQGNVAPPVVTNTIFCSDIKGATKTEYRGMNYIRIVHLGNAYCDFEFKALEYILNNWNVEDKEKNVQFVINRDTSKREFLNFWEGACIQKLCEQIEYIDLSKYLPFGHYKGKCRKYQRNEKSIESNDIFSKAETSTPF
jgi:hypothetical protein